MKSPGTRPDPSAPPILEVRHSLAELRHEIKEDLSVGGLSAQLLDQKEITRVFKARKGRRADRSR